MLDSMSRMRQGIWPLRVAAVCVGVGFLLQGCGSTDSGSAGSEPGMTPAQVSPAKPVKPPKPYPNPKKVAPKPGASEAEASSAPPVTRGTDQTMLPDSSEYDPSLPPDEQTALGGAPIAVSAIAFEDDFVFERNKPVAILLLPYSNTRKQYVCETFFDAFQPYGDRPDDAPASVAFINTDNRRVTFWLDKRERRKGLAELKEIDFNDRKAYCEDLIENYDFERAGHILATLELTGKSGPVLYGYFNDRSYDLVFDLTSFRDDDIRRTFQIWERRVIRDPKTWNEGFGWVARSEIWRTRFRDYSEHIFIIFSGSAKAAAHLR